MQTDMHYYGTYALARAAGIKPDHAKNIATASQFVDDSKTLSQAIADGSYIDYRATAHGTSIKLPEIGDTSMNLDIEDQRHVWLPFHFLPGGSGDSLPAKLICQMDSAIAQEMVAHNLSLAAQPYGGLLIGITAHVYADTFSHYGFSGISSSLNEVADDSFDLHVQDQGVLGYIKQKADDFLEEGQARAADLLKLGHGGAATFPDRPYLTWSFKYADGRESGVRNNPETFLLACEKLHAMFVEFSKTANGFYSQGDGRNFADISDAIRNVLSVEGAMDARVAAWQAAAAAETVFSNPTKGQIPEYDSSDFENDAQSLPGLSSAQVKNTFVYVFMKAANTHRQYVLHELLPAHGIDVVIP